MKHLQISQVQAAHPYLSQGSGMSGTTPWGTDAFHAAMLQDVPLFAGLGAAQRLLLAANMRVRAYQANETIVAQGDRSGALFVLQKGHAVFYRADAQKREFILGDLLEGEHFGEMSLVDGLPHSTSVRATQRSIVLTLGEADFARCLASDQGFCMAVLMGLSRRLRRADATVRSLALLDVRSRIEQKLAELAEDVDGRRVIRRRLSRTELAKRVGASREMVSRILADMQAHGLFTQDESGALILTQMG